MVTLELKEISKKIGSRQVLDHVSFKTGEMELFALTGPPSVGKTTLLKVIAGLSAPDDGEILVGGEDITRVSASERGIGMVFENPAVYPNRTGFENIAFPLKIARVSSAETRKRVGAIAETLGITHLLDRRPATYSGGELQRVALARALVRSPRILLLDEPLKNLDAKIRETTRIELRRLQKEFGITMVFSTHDQLEATAVGDRIAVMKQGVIEQIGAPEEVYCSPRTLFVARFIGSPTMNLTECVLKRVGDRWLVDASNFNVDVTSHAHGMDMEAMTHELLLGVRPEDVIVVGSPESGRCFEGRVELTQDFGDERVVNIRVGNVSLNCLTGKDRVFGYGQEVYVKLREEKVHLFHRETGMAVARNK